MNLLMMMKYVWRFDAVFQATVLPAALVLANSSIPFWVWVAGRLDKRHVAICGYLATAAMLLGASLCDDTNPLLAAAFVFGFGGPMGLSYLMPLSLLPDVIENDELRTGQNHAGLFSGFFAMPLKFAVVLSTTATNSLLAIGGYQAPQSTCGSSVESVI